MSKRRSFRTINIVLVSISVLWVGVSVVLFGLIVVSSIVEANRESVQKAAYETRVQAHPLTTASILSDVNEQRTARNIAPLSQNAELQKAAEAKCSDMQTRQYYEHTGPDGRTAKDWLGDYTKNWKTGNENLNKGDFRASFEVVDSWVNSPGHKNTMLDAKFTDSGIAICDYEDGQKVIVQHFAAYYTTEEIQAMQPRNTNVNVYQRRSPVTCHTYGGSYGIPLTTSCY